MVAMRAGCFHSCDCFDRRRLTGEAVDRRWRWQVNTADLRLLKRCDAEGIVGDDSWPYSAFEAKCSGIIGLGNGNVGSSATLSFIGALCKIARVKHGIALTLCSTRGRGDSGNVSQHDRLDRKDPGRWKTSTASHNAQR